MNVTDVLRRETLSVRDELGQLDEQIAQAEALRNAAEERVKRAGTEITRQRTLDTERRRALSIIAERVMEAQKVLDELERKRREADEALMRVQDEHKSVERLRREAQAATETAVAQFGREQKTRQDTESQLAALKVRRKECECGLHRALLKGLDVHLEQQVATLQAAFSTQEQRSKVMQQFEEMRKARHTDSEVGRLCDERDEIRKLLGNVMVPGVRAMLQTSLKQIEETLSKRFPGALQMPEIAPKDNQIEELLFYCDREGKAVFLLPISPVDWSELDKGTLDDRTSKSMCLVWNMVRGLGLRSEDGDFIAINSRPAFASEFDLETVAGQSFSVKYEAGEIIRYVFTPVPADLQEALSHEEDQDN
jgi:flagellar biosynthesis chaperone FliJ